MSRQLLNEIKDLKKIETILSEAHNAGMNAIAKGSVGGCGRVYVNIGKIRSNSKLASLVGKYFKFTSRPYSSYNQIYVGYDNATGKEWNQGELIAEVFRSHNISAYVDGDGD